MFEQRPLTGQQAAGGEQSQTEPDVLSTHRGRFRGKETLGVLSWVRGVQGVEDQGQPPALGPSLRPGVRMAGPQEPFRTQSVRHFPDPHPTALWGSVVVKTVDSTSAVHNSVQK